MRCAVRTILGRRRIRQIFCVFAYVAVVSCDTDDTKEGSRAGKECGVVAYIQNFITPVGLIVVAWGNDPKGSGSGFLVNREKGIFMTADHVVDVMHRHGKNSADLFFNGKVYTVIATKVLSLDDAALMQIVCSRKALKIAAASFPDPFTLASARAGIGDHVVIMGVHPHPFLIRESNAEEGIPDRILPIASQYYKIIQNDVTKEEEAVSDSLPSIVVGLDEHAPSIKSKDRAKYDPFEVMRDSVNTYTHVKTARDHKFSFAGLSGGPILNERGELIGIVTKERECPPHLLSSRIYPCEDIFFTPIHKKEVRNLLFSVR